MAAGFQRCARSIAIDEAPQGRTRHRLEIRLGPNGEVTSAEIAPGSPLPASLITCLVDRARMAQFPERGDGRVVVELAIELER